MPEEMNAYPNKGHYASGYIFDLSLNHYEKHTEDELKEEFLASGHPEANFAAYIAVVKEGMAFHDLEIGSQHPRTLAKAAAAEPEADAGPGEGEEDANV